MAEAEVLKHENFIYHELLEAARKANTDYFINSLKIISKEDLSAIFDQVGPSGNSLLHVAISSGSKEIAKLIASEFPSLIVKKDIKGNTALHLAARSGMLDITRILTCPDADISSGISSFSSRKDSAESTRASQLLRMKNVYGNTALHEAVMNGHHAVAQFLVSEDPEVRFYQNLQGCSPLCIAIKKGYQEILQSLLSKLPTGHDDSFERLEGNSAAYAAIMEGKLDMLEEMVKAKPELLRLRDRKGRSVLHWAAYEGKVDAVRFISSRSKSRMFEMDNKGFLPIHVATERGHVDVIKELLKQWPCPTELLNKQGQSILHVAAKSGKSHVVRYILETPALKELLNEKDINGNTPLHLAATHSHVAVVLTLTRDKEINLNLLNNHNLTAFDLCPKISSGPPRARHCLTNGALWSAGARPGSSLTLHKRKGETFQEPKSPNIEYIKERIGILLLLEILVATVTFTAAFTVPGGYNSSDGPDKGMATMLNYNMFQVFVICITAAFYSSIVSIFFAFWTTLSDIHLVVSLYRLSVCLLGLALGMMSLPFMAAIHLAVNKLTWLASYTLFIGIVSFHILLFMLTCTFPFRFSNPFMQYISYYICQILIILFGNDSIENTGEREPEEIQQFVKDEQQKSSPYGLDKQENLQQSSQEEQTSLKRKHERIIDAAWPRYTLAGNDLDFTLQL